MDVSLTNGPANGPGRLWPAIEALPRRFSVPVSQQTIRKLLPIAAYLAFVLLMHAMTSVRPGDVAAAKDTYLCKRH